MVRALRCSTLALLVLTALLSACQRKDKEETRYEAFPATMPAPTPVLTAAEAGASQHLNSAHENFVSKHLAEAADEIRSAADRLKADAKAAPGEARQEMRDAASGLDRVERDVRSGTLESVEKLDREFAEANASLARFHALRATDAWVGRDQRAAGREIVAAVDELEAGTRRLGHELSADASSFAHHAREMGHELVKGGRVADRDVGMILRGLDREIDALFRDLRKP
jgi:hypothetical protein